MVVYRKDGKIVVKEQGKEEVENLYLAIQRMKIAAGTIYDEAEGALAWKLLGKFSKLMNSNRSGWVDSSYAASLTITEAELLKSGLYNASVSDTDAEVKAYAEAACRSLILCLGWVV